MDRVLFIQRGVLALAARNRLGGLHRAAFWRKFGFPNLVRARAALSNKVRLHRLEEWKREELTRTPFALLDAPRGAQAKEGEEVIAGRG